MQDATGSRGGRALVVGVVGARGGVGASTLAAGLARVLSQRTATVLVDLDRASAGIDVLLGLESADGVRWPDLSGARGEVSGSDVVALLPRWGSCAVLSADRHRPGAADPAVVADVLHAVTAAVGGLVLDLDRGSVMAGESVVGVCDAVLVVAAADLGSVAGVLAMRPHLDASGARTALVVRSGGGNGPGVAEVVSAVGLPVAAVLRPERRVAGQAHRGGVPGAGRAARVSDRLARDLLADHR